MKHKWKSANISTRTPLCTKLRVKVGTDGYTNLFFEKKIEPSQFMVTFFQDETSGVWESKNNECVN